MFDISVTGTSSININGFAQNFYDTSATTISGFELWTIAGGVTGNTANSSAWTLISSTGSFTSNTRGTPTNIPFSTSISISLNPGQTIGIYLTNQSGSTYNSYSVGTGVGNVAATNSNLTIYEGYGVGYPFGLSFFPRIWNGTIFYSAGPSAADTQSSLNTLSESLRSYFNATAMAMNYANMNTYDCNLFDKNNMCISAGGRITTIDNPSSHHSAAVVVLGHKISPHIRIGGFLDQSVNHNMPSGVDMSNKNPMAGAFAVWNHQADGLGFQMKLANAYLDKDVTTSRAVVGTSEAGRGRTDLNTQSYVGELSYAFNYQDSTIVRPYFALRYTRIKQDGYTEDTTASVTSPLTYAKLSDRSTSALMGVKLNHSLTPRTNLTASLGIEQDLDHKSDQLVATGVSGLTSENFNNNIRHTRPVASLGAYYAVAKNQRLSGDIYYQQLPFQSTDSATAYVNYMIGF
ncbi:autotransporter domain-containing protein [Candidatus Methylopumilus universalis]|uniref:autotransporter outer membrane beta-barrel domain-containing protein n=1 Tax=Candidatus Methylopumilus universalis TaxID=2588536 RepID=UPI003BEF21F5